MNKELYRRTTYDNLNRSFKTILQTNNRSGCQPNHQVLLVGYDTFDDNASLLGGEINDVTWQTGNVSLESVLEQQSFFDNFDDGVLGSNWTTYSSDGSGRISPRTEDSYSGTYSVIADTSASGTYNLNELRTNYDFSGAKSIYLSFRFREWSDENNGGSDHSGTQNAEGVYFTCDGSNWYHLYDLLGDATWQEVNINITADSDFCSTIDSNFKIKFTQYDNWPVTDDGIGFDNINITYLFHLHSLQSRLLQSTQEDLPVFWTETKDFFKSSNRKGRIQIHHFLC